MKVLDIRIQLQLQQNKIQDHLIMMMKNVKP